VLLTFTGRTACPIKHSFYSKLKSLQFAVNLPLWSYSVRTNGHSFSNSEPVSPLFAAFSVVQAIVATIDIALYLHNSTSHHKHSYSKYALADCSLIFSFVSNYDRLCVYCISAVSIEAHCFTDVIMEAMNLTIPQISLESTNSLTLVFIH